MGTSPTADRFRWGEAMDCPEWDIPARWKEEIDLIDLSSYSDKELAVPGKLGPFLLALKHAYDPNITRVVRDMVGQLQQVELEDNGQAFLVSLFKYLYRTSEPESREELDEIAVKSFTRETGGKIMTIAEQLLEEGAEKVIGTMIRKGADKDYILYMTEVDPETLERLWQKYKQ